MRSISIPLPHRRRLKYLLVPLSLSICCLPPLSPSEQHPFVGVGGAHLPPPPPSIPPESPRAARRHSKPITAVRSGRRGRYGGLRKSRHWPLWFIHTSALSADVQSPWSRASALLTSTVLSKITFRSYFPGLRTLISDLSMA